MIRDNLKRGTKASKLKAYNEGYSAGQTAGDTQGYSRGYSEGEAAGDTAGYSRGYGKGKEDGDSEGYTRGYDKGKTDGDSEGYTRGYNKGQQDYTPVTQTKTVTPSTSAQSVVPDSGKYLVKVDVTAIPNQRSGSMGTINPSSSAQTINVPAGWYNGDAYFNVGAVPEPTYVDPSNITSLNDFKTTVINSSDSLTYSNRLEQTSETRGSGNKRITVSKEKRYVYITNGRSSYYGNGTVSEISIVRGCQHPQPFRSICPVPSGKGSPPLRS